jgi:hypothetical protein
MSRITKRPQNFCMNCWYTWYPRGKYVSRECPWCGSRRVEVLDLTWFWLLVLLTVLIILLIMN